jgi:predicted transcriptional regulator YheO
MKKPLYNDDAILAYHVTLAQVIAETFSPITETVVNDLRPQREKVLAIFNGRITGRKVGDSVSDVGKKRMKGQIPDVLINYQNEGANGQFLKSSATAIRNEKGELIGSFGINVDMSIYDMLQDFIHQFKSIKTNTVKHEKFTKQTPKEDIFQAIKDYVAKKKWSPLNLSKPQKIEIITTLYQQGHFYKRGAVAIIANALNLTRPSVYKYIKAIP